MPLAPDKPELNAVWTAIDYEVTYLHMRWVIYSQLFGTSEARINTFNQSAATCAKIFQDVLLDDVQLGLAKLGDRSSENLTLENLCKLVASSGDLAKELQSLRKTFTAACKEIKTRRNKRIAHFDKKTMLNPEARSTGVSRTEIETALKALRAVMNRIAQHYARDPVAYNLMFLDNDGEALIATLKLGLRYQELVQAGTIPPEDLFNTLSD